MDKRRAIYRRYGEDILAKLKAHPVLPARLQERLLQNLSFATATANICSFVARRAKNCKQPKAASLCIEPKVRSNRLLQQAQETNIFYGKYGKK
jgi:hypothetical protein